LDGHLHLLLEAVQFYLCTLLVTGISLASRGMAKLPFKNFALFHVVQ
jgi:hypothetical protein